MNAEVTEEVRITIRVIVYDDDTYKGTVTIDALAPFVGSRSCDFSGNTAAEDALEAFVAAL